MGVLELLFGRTGDDRDDRCRIPSEHDEVTYVVTRESHDVAYAVVVREAELEALSSLLRADRETPYVEGDGDGADGADDAALASALEAAFDDPSVDVGAFRERLERPRRAAAAVLEAWRDLGIDEVGVGYLPIGAHADLAAFVQGCRRRHEREDDPFTLPEDVERVAALLARIKRASERPENRVVVNRERLPVLDGEEGSEDEDDEDVPGEDADAE
ncbi:hypothetical protein [Salinilacihabitans rarus]|uniref:hypothetical protein n=1 Tax=Salinilacihabitans rarus TaxID=2961596 RepID=UPI0020C89E17|nr:hypothetical protein [Salinilacihabitans rarus]